MSVQILYPVLTLAILASGCRWTGANPACTSAELQHHVEKSGAQIIVTTFDLLACVKTAVKNVEDDVDIVVYSDILQDKPRADSPNVENDHGFTTLHDMLRNRDTTSMVERLESIDGESIATLMSTSGSTGLPKLAQRTHMALIQESRVIEDNEEMKPYDVRRLYCTPAIWGAYPFPAMVINSLRLGIPSYFVKQFEGSLVNKIYKYNITEIVLVPHVVCSILDQCSKDPKPIEIQSLQMVSSAGAPLAPALRERFLERFVVPPRIVQVWGLTECGWLSTFKYPESDDTGSVGRMLPGCEIRTCSEDVTTNGDGVGELCVRGPQLMTGYRGNEAATAKAVRSDGWFYTGNIGYIENGKVYIVGRLKDIIKVNGFVVSRTELEDALYKCPGVSDCAAFGKGYGVDEHPVLSIVAAEDGLSADRIRDHLHSNLSSYKADKCEVHFVESIPRNRGRKILRDRLKQEVNK